MSADPKATVCAFLEAMDRADWEALRACMHADHRCHFPFAPEPLDQDAHIGMSQGFRQGFAEFQHLVEDQFADGDQVLTRGKVRVKHTGEFNGVPATGNVVEFGFMQVAEVVAGTVRNEWIELDGVKLMQGIGA